MRCRIPLGLLFLAPVLCAGAASLGAGSADSGPVSPAAVKQLVGQLGAADEEKQVAAEWSLLKLGPDILPLLPRPEPGDKGAQAQRLRSVSATLKELLPRTVTLHRKGIALGEALKELTKQTGIAVRNRLGAGSDPKIDVSADDLPFWKVLDTIAAAAGARVSLYEGDGTPALVAAPASKTGAAPPVSYHGLFRTTVKHVSLARDLETGTHTCALHLEAAWEPRFQPFLVDVGSARVAFAKDDRGTVRKGTLPPAGATAVTGRTAVEVDLRLRAPERSSPRIDRIAGSLVVLGPSKMLTFTFDKLRFIAPRDKGERQEQDGISVRLSEVAKDPDGWAVEVVIDNPPGGPRFESYQSWLGNNAIWLEKGAGNARQFLRPSSAGEERLKETAAQAVVRYLFTAKGNRGGSFGKLSDWTLVYRTPGRMVEVAVPYEFKGVPLP